MAQFSTSIGAENINPLAAYFSAQGASNENDLAQQKIQAAQMANDATRQLQPAQIQGMLAAYGQLNDSSTPAASGPTASAAPATGGGGIDVADAIHGQESGGRATAPNSTKGAMGGWQIIPATFAQYAKPGEDIGNPVDNQNVGRRIIGDLKQKFGNDPARVAVGYFSGPDNVAPAGSPTPWIKDKSDGTTSTSSYVSSVLARMGRAPSNQFAGPGAPSAQAVPQATTDGAPIPNGAVEDKAATQSVRQLIAARNLAMMTPGGAGMRAVAAIQAQLDNIAGPGGIVASDGRVYRVPGADATRAAASFATKSGEIGPTATMAQNKSDIDYAQLVREIGPKAALEALNAETARKTHAINSAVDTEAATQRPTKLGPGETLTTPATVGVGVSPVNPLMPPPGTPVAGGPTNSLAPPLPQAAAPQLAPQAAAPGAPAQPAGMSIADAQSHPGLPAAQALAQTVMAAPPDQRPAVYAANRQKAVDAGAVDAPPTYPGDQAMQTVLAVAPAPPAPQRPGVYQAPPVDPVATANTEAAKKEAENSVEIQKPIVEQARESQNALNRIGQVRAAIKQATANGIPPGYFSPALAEGAAAAKSLGIDLSTLGINPAAIQNEQVAREALTQINGEILKRMFPQRITNADVKTFGANLAQFGMDPAALEPILTQAEKSAAFDVTRAHDLLAYKAQHNGNALGWEAQFHQKNGFGPDLFDAVKTGTVPSANSAPTTKAEGAPAAQYSLQNPATPKTREDVQALPSGTPFLNPATGKVMLRH